MGNRIHLTDDEIASVVERAHEISSLEGRLDTEKSDLEQYVKIAEEMGVPRVAMEQALNERFAFLEEKLEEGQMVFAESGDKYFYLARIVASGENSVQVEFFNGGDGTVGRHELQRATFAPGTLYDYYSPMKMMYVRGRVARYDKQNLTVTFNTWGVEETVPVAKVRLRKDAKTGVTLSSWMIAVATGLGGAAFATFITWLAMR